MSGKIKLRSALWILVSLFFGYCCIKLIIPLVMIQNEDKILKEELANPYISTDFASWKNVNIPGFGEIMLPNNWDMTEHGCGYQLEDSSGSIMAYCAELGSDKSYHDTGMFLADLLSDSSIEISFEYFPGVTQIHSSDFCSVSATNKLGEANIFYRVNLYKNSDEKFVLLYPVDNGISEDSLFEIAQAMIYAYCFVVVK